MIIIGIVEILITRSEKLMDFWYSIGLMRFSKFSKDDDKVLTLVSGIIAIIVGIIGIFLLRD
jgi:hypothetical protein